MKTKQSVVEADDLKNWEQQYEELKEEGRWEEALTMLRLVADEKHATKLYEVLQYVEPDAEQLRQQDTGSSWFLLGFMIYYGVGGVERHFEEAYDCLSRGTKVGHLMCMHLQGHMLKFGQGVELEMEAGILLQVRAAELGCRFAFSDAGSAYQYGDGVEQSYSKAAQWFLKAGEDCEDKLNRMLEKHPIECCPFGEWRPELQRLVPAVVNQAQRTALLVSRRLGLPRHVALKVVEYVCTEGKDWEDIIRGKSSERACAIF